MEKKLQVICYSDNLWKNNKKFDCYSYSIFPVWMFLVKIGINIDALNTWFAAQTGGMDETDTVLMSMDRHENHDVFRRRLSVARRYFAATVLTSVSMPRSILNTFHFVPFAFIGM